MLGIPCKLSDSVHFRKRMGEFGVELIINEIIGINCKDIDDEIQKNL